MKVDVVIEIFQGCIQEVSVHLSEDKASELVKKWFGENYSKNDYEGWKNRLETGFEFNLDHEIYQFETDIMGSDGADLCKNCREHKSQPEPTGLTDEEFQRIAAEWDNYDHDTRCMILDGIGYSSKYADYKGSDLTHGLAKEIDQFKPKFEE